jgi:hypothetical protein
VPGVLWLRSFHRHRPSVLTIIFLCFPLVLSINCATVYGIPWTLISMEGEQLASRSQSYTDGNDHKSDIYVTNFSTDIICSSRVTLGAGG